MQDFFHQQYFTNTKCSSILGVIENRLRKNTPLSPLRWSPNFVGSGLPCLKLTAKALENWCLEYDRFFLGFGGKWGKLFVSGRVRCCFFYFGKSPWNTTISGICLFFSDNRIRKSKWTTRFSVPNQIIRKKTGWRMVMQEPCWLRKYLEHTFPPCKNCLRTRSNPPANGFEKKA